MVLAVLLALEESRNPRTKQCSIVGFGLRNETEVTGRASSFLFEQLVSPARTPRRLTRATGGVEWMMPHLCTVGNRLMPSPLCTTSRI
jgi:hypothetical protein